MPVTFEWKSVDLVISTAENLRKASEQLTQVAAEMQQNGMKEALFPWTQRQWTCLDAIVDLANNCKAVLPSQVQAKQQNRPSRYELMQKKSQRDMATRKARLEAGSDAPAKPRGRPRKKKATGDSR